MPQVARPSTPPSKHTESSRLPAICDTRLLECVPDNKMRGMLNARRFLVLLVANLSIWAPYPGLAELPKGNSEKLNSQSRNGLHRDKPGPFVGSSAFLGLSSHFNSATESG